MFDIGFWELIFIIFAALLLVGPERLPGIAVKLGNRIARVRNMFRLLHHDLEKMIRMSEVNKLTDRVYKLERLLEEEDKPNQKEKQRHDHD